MVITQGKSKKSQTGSRYKKSRSKRQYEKGNKPILTKLGAKRVKTTRTRGGLRKSSLLSVDLVNLYDPKSKKHSSAKIKTIKENPANRHFVRRNIMTKGALIETEKGVARITNRPGQDGIINAVLV